jgi:hypothetical protein
MPIPKNPGQSAAALRRVANEGGDAISAPARLAFYDSFEDQVDPDRELPEADRLTRANAARRAYFTKLAAKSAKVRGEKAAARRYAAELRQVAAAIESQLTDDAPVKGSK